MITKCNKFNFFVFLLLILLILSNTNLIFSQNVNYALQFDGVDDYVEVVDDTSLQITNQITLETWINFQEGGTYQPRIISKGT